MVLRYAGWCKRRRAPGVHGSVAGSAAVDDGSPRCNTGAKERKQVQRCKRQGAAVSALQSLYDVSDPLFPTFFKNRRERMFHGRFSRKKGEVYSTLMKFFPASPQIGHVSGAFPISMFPHQGQRKTSAPSKSFPARTASRAFV